MSRRSPDWVVPVADLLARPGTSRTVELAGPLVGATDLARTVEDGPVRATVRLESLTDGILVTAQVEAPVRLTCNRCLTEWEETERLELVQLFGTEPDEDGYRIEHDSLDLEAPLRDEIILAMPLVPLCDEGCRGLCGVCGADLNTAPCPGHEERPVSPFEGLKDLLAPRE